MLVTVRTNHIDANVQLEASSCIWRLTGFYGEPDTAKRKITWNLLKRLGTQSRREWLVVGDFNEMLHHGEKLGGPLMPEWRLRDFRETLTQNNLVDLGFKGYHFTWTNKRENDTNTKLRLDRAVASPRWKQIFHLTCRRSDHSPLLARFFNSSQQLFCPRKSFRFEAVWLKSTECAKVIRGSWSENGNLQDNLDRCTVGLANWSRAEFPNIRAEIQRVNKELEFLQRVQYTSSILDE